MPDTPVRPGPLTPYKILDLCTDSSWLCGKWLADLGAQVLKVEPTGGDNGHNKGSLAGQQASPDDDLRRRFMNQGKQSITLNLETEAGRDIFKLLVKEADAVIESFPTGWLEERGIDYKELKQINPKIVFTSISPFGRTGPYANHSGTDLVISALSGLMYVTGDEDRPPLRISVPQTLLHGSAEAGVNTTIALYHAARTGCGQHVDVSSQLATTRALMNATAYPPLEGRNLQRSGPYMHVGPARWRLIFQAKDGHVCIMLTGGSLGGTTIRGFLNWAGEYMEIPAELTAIAWEKLELSDLIFDEEKRKLLDTATEIFNKFFVLHTKEELYERSLNERLMLAPVSTVADIREDVQLNAREYFTPVQEMDGTSLHYPGAWARLSKTPLNVNRRAPSAGEHNDVVYRDKLGISQVEMDELASAGVI